MYFCETCRKPVYNKFGSGRFCCRKCSNSRKHSEETKKKISITLQRRKPKTKSYIPSIKYLNILKLQDDQCIELGRYNKGKPIIVKPNDKGCLICVSHVIDKYGYIRYYYKGRANLLHRVLWIENYGEIPEGYVIRHKCDTPSCCNINHYEIGTQKDNVMDMIIRGKGNSQKNNIYKNWKLD